MGQESQKDYGYTSINITSFGESTETSKSDDIEDSADTDDDPSRKPSPNTALPHDISTSDETTVLEAMKSPEGKGRQNAITEEFETLRKAGTWTQHGHPARNPLPIGMILRLKRD